MTGNDIVSADDVNEAPLSSHDMPANMWEISEAFIEDADLRELYSQIILNLQRENPDADTLEMMMMERVASGFVFMRSREAEGTFGGHEYKNLTTLWVSMAADLRKTRTNSSDIVAMKDEIHRDVLNAFEESLKGVDLDVQLVIRSRMMEALR